MTIALSILAGILQLIGFIGCIVPVLPGPIIGYCGLLALIPTEKRSVRRHLYSSRRDSWSLR